MIKCHHRTRHYIRHSRLRYKLLENFDNSSIKYDKKEIFCLTAGCVVKQIREIEHYSLRWLIYGNQITDGESETFNLYQYTRTFRTIWRSSLCLLPIFQSTIVTRDEQMMLGDRVYIQRTRKDKKNNFNKHGFRQTWNVLMERYVYACACK